MNKIQVAIIARLEYRRRGAYACRDVGVATLESMMTTIVLKIPFPPTVNHIWTRVGNRSFLTREYRRFLALVVGAVESAKVAPGFKEAPAYSVQLTVFPPDRRARDLDNFLKAALDAVTRAQLCPDDSLVCQLSATKGAPAEKPFAVLEITALQCATTARQPEDYGEKTRKYNK